MVAEVEEGGGGVGSRGLATPLQRPCLHRTAGCSVRGRAVGGGRKSAKVETACKNASKRAEDPRLYRRLRRRPQSM